MPRALRPARTVRRALATLAALAALALSAPLAAADVMVLEFELNDLTLYPNVAQEAERVASLRPLLVEALAGAPGITLIDPPPDAAREASLGAGYVFERPAVAARLGREGGADWVVTGRLHKASHLFVYVKAQLIDVARGQIAGDFVVELKGWSEKLTRRGVDTLATQLRAALDTLSPNADGGAVGDAATGGSATDEGATSGTTASRTADE